MPAAASSNDARRTCYSQLLSEVSLLRRRGRGRDDSMRSPLPRPPMSPSTRTIRARFGIEALR